MPNNGHVVEVSDPAKVGWGVPSKSIEATLLCICHCFRRHSGALCCRGGGVGSAIPDIMKRVHHASNGDVVEISDHAKVGWGAIK